MSHKSPYQSPDVVMTTHPINLYSPGNEINGFDGAQDGKHKHNS